VIVQNDEELDSMDLTASKTRREGSQHELVILLDRGRHAKILDWPRSTNDD